VGVLLGVSFLGLSQGVEVGDLISGRWALLFVVIPGCPACEEVLPWFSQAAQAFPEIRFLLVAPWSTDELRKLAGAIPVYIDGGGMLGASLGVKRAPTVVFWAGGVPVHRLEWPFDRAKLEKGLEEVLAHPVPDPRALLGHLAPDFLASNLEGEPVLLASLPKPILLVFFNPGCPACWEDFPILAELSQEVTIVLLVVGELSPEEFGRLRTVASEKVMVLSVKDFKVLEAYQVVRSPTYFLVDEKGVVIWVKEGNLVLGVVEKVREVLKKNN
jgi:thiol-disulfide isomerase/thioredoxin